ncbi:MAG TPA: ATP-binding protein [Vicinamibacterales bacterium]|jgi:PAS domain S-box-containing protein|nr:ATP-binding protein [Vicinamibacterales bacterium]
MGWLAAGIFYSIAYASIGRVLVDQPSLLSWFRAVALFIPPLTGVVVIARRRKQWRGCQWLFWSTIGLGLTMSAIGLTGWAADELVYKRETWLAWPAVFALFGAVAPLFALLAQPHRGSREPLAATTAVDIAGLAVVTGFLYSFFVTAPPERGTNPLQVVSELQQGLVVVGMLAAMVVARQTPWRDTYRRLALGALVGFAMLSLSNFEAGHGLYRGAYVYDFTWIVPFAFFPWAASSSPTAEDDHALTGDEEDGLTRPRPWVIFAAVAMIPFLDFALRRITPDAASSFRDLSTAVTFISVLPLLVARIAAERAELQQADGTMKLLTQVIEQAQDLILVLTPDGHVRHANQAFCRAIGVPREALMTMRSVDLMAPQLVSADEIQDLVQRGGSWRGTVTRSRGDGSMFPVAASVAALVDDRGRPTHVVSVERDISEEKRLREQLIHSERLSAVGELVAGVAHELNNPLQSVMGFTELLLRREERAEVRRDLERVQHDADRAAKIVRNLLSFVRRSALERSLVDLNAVARSTVALKAFDLQTGQIELVEDYDEDLPFVSASREEMGQIILNLVSNAEQALKSARRPGVITVRTGVADDSVFIEVSDDGPGIPPDLAGRIFEPFFTTKAVGQGTGLGLSISLGIAEAHGGTLTLAAPQPGRGATLRLTLPLAARHTASSPALADLRAGGLAS